MWQAPGRGLDRGLAGGPTRVGCAGAQQPGGLAAGGLVILAAAPSSSLPVMKPVRLVQSWRASAPATPDLRGEAKTMSEDLLAAGPRPADLSLSALRAYRRKPDSRVQELMDELDTAAIQHAKEVCLLFPTAN